MSSCPDSPDSNAVAAVAPAPLDLASPWIRLGAVLSDGVITCAVVLPLMVMGGYWDTDLQNPAQIPLGMELLWSLIAFIVIVAIDAYPLHRYGQSWGKRLLGIQIVGMQGQRMTLGSLIFRRYLPVQIFVSVPGVGSVLSLIDAVGIFASNRRCLHDLTAGTQVIVHRPD